ncbi:hypothetical protein G6016_12960 [Dietzia aerolata]|uniref:PH domain-containing protein n=1 Tax=Dietzia aerolata TaxID=595984 RepID=A0ABV5JU03_9ACTN|nr:hypothetical protein [Dietzia aerolata]MBB0969851.1 hypothetical protein [Dietzia aerolata]
MNQNFWTVVVVIVALLIIIGLMTRGWRNRARSQAHLFDTVPQPPDDPGDVVLGPLTGVYIGSTVAGDWQARIARPPLGHRSAGKLTAYTNGLHLELANDDVWIPRADLVEVRRASALANKTVPGGGILAARWKVAAAEGHTVIDSGFRADDKDSYPQWEALRGDDVVDTDTDIEHDTSTSVDGDAVPSTDTTTSRTEEKQ